MEIIYLRNYRGRIRSVESYFNSINKGIDQIIRVRGGKEIKVTVSSARLKVSSHSKKRFVSGSRYFCESLFWASQPKQAAKT
ncbi:hypothetical protein [Bathymodiolus japonicus methanotrophic gill symbiont]|uniref:hypothetical protein n=1 Tax=Bathymodiolus japonicus methanotrophic gill symbiont TaxID=113269 RepID=UPI001C8D100E|nr:hypothetical protein [Bathymodiolus japonicus methanotrophic gill symbiont]